jgi:hypothetical protein
VCAWCRTSPAASAAIAPADLIEFLATFETEGADLEPDNEREPECDYEEDPEGDDLDHGEAGISRGATPEQRARYRRNRAADAGSFRPLRVLRRGDGDAR